MRHAVRFASFACLLALAVPARAGLFDFFHLPSSQPDVAAAVAEARAKEYLEEVLGLKSLTIKDGHGAPTADELKSMDSHITSRMQRAPAMITAKLSAEGVTGIVVLAGPGVNDKEWDPSKGYLGCVQLDTGLVFPSDADRAYSLAVKVLGERALFNFAPEAGPVWKVTERYLQAGATAGGMPGAGAAQLAADDGSAVPYQVEAGEKAPEADEVPAWVVRGLTDLKYRKQKAQEIGLLMSLTRRPASTCVRATHVTGLGPIGKALFKDAQRLPSDE